MAFTKPLLLLDVDGPLNPYQQITRRSFIPPKRRKDDEVFDWTVHQMHPRGWEDADLRVLLSDSMAPHFERIQRVFDVVWATAWEDDANKWIAPHVGLPTLPVIHWPAERAKAVRLGSRGYRGSWKTNFIAEWLDLNGWYYSETGVLERLPWVWVDDEVRSSDRQHLRDHWREPDKASTTMPRLLFEVPPTRGITSGNFDELVTWGQAHSIKVGHAP